jgi:hypothetical protein
MGKQAMKPISQDIPRRASLTKDNHWRHFMAILDVLLIQLNNVLVNLLANLSGLSGLNLIDPLPAICRLSHCCSPN